MPKALAGGLVHPGGNAFDQLGELLHLHLQILGAGHGLAGGLGLADLTLREAAHVVVEVGVLVTTGRKIAVTVSLSHQAVLKWFIDLRDPNKRHVPES